MGSGLLVGLGIGVLAACAACGTSKNHGFQPSDGGSTASTLDGADPMLFDKDGGIAPATDCTEDNKQIYVVTQEKALYRFAPASNSLTKVGNVDCKTGAQPFSMAVDRKGTGWVLHDDGHIFQVSTKDASCVPTTFKPDQNGFHRFGMAFVSDGPGSASETLFVANNDGTGIGKIDTNTLVLTDAGSYDGFAAPGELTGTGSARLFAFFTAKAPINDPRVAELDPKTGRIIDFKTLAGTEIGAGWAFAHWGGDFRLFTAPSGSSEITRYSWDKDSSASVKQNLGYVIVGAGVSTCAPTTPPA